MQNTPFLALLRPIFALKTKIANPPLLVMAIRIGQRPDVTCTRKLGCNLTEDFFFWRSAKFGEKNRNDFSEDVFLRSPKFRQKNRLNLIEDRLKCES